MDKLAEIKKRLQEFGLKPNLPITAKVLSVENDTCTIELCSGLIITDVRLKATITSGEDSFLTTPQVGSDVILISQTGELSGLMVIKVDKVAKLKYKQNNLEVVIDSEDGKISIKNQAVSLKTLFDDLAALLREFKVATPVGPSGVVLPGTILKIEKFKNSLNQILK